MAFDSQAPETGTKPAPTSISLSLEGAAYHAWQLAEIIEIATDMNAEGAAGGTTPPLVLAERVNAILSGAGALARALQASLLRVAEAAEHE